MTPTPFAIAGGGWRAAFFLRIAAAMPERFRVTGVAAGEGEEHFVEAGQMQRQLADRDARLAEPGHHFTERGVGLDRDA